MGPARRDGAPSEASTADRRTRRRYLAGVAAAGATAVAGCSGGGGGGGNRTDGSNQPAGSALTNVPGGPCQSPPRESTTTVEQQRDVGSDTTFGTDADVVQFEGGLTVGHDATVTIEPGTTVEFGEGTQLLVQGTLEAAGSCEEPIFFTGTDDRTGAWQGITFSDDGGSGTLDYALVENGGTADGAAVDHSSSQGVAITNSEIRGSANYGVRIASHASVDAFGGNGITDNREPIWLAGWHAHHVGDDNALTGNETDRIHVLASVDYPIAEGESRTWADPGVPYYLTQGDRYTFEVNGDLTLVPGVELRFDEGNGILVRGSLNATIPEESLPAEGPMESAPDDAIVLRGAQANRGHWEGLMYENTQEDNVLSGVVVRHAGGEPSERGIYQEPAGVSVLAGSRVTIEGALIEQNGGYGVFATKDNDLRTIARARIRDNADPVQVFFTTVPTLATSSSYTGNDTDRVEIVNPTNPIEQSLTVPAIDVPYRLPLSRNGSLLGLETHVTIPDGTAIHFGEDAGINVQQEGSLRIEGSATGDGSEGGGDGETDGGETGGEADDGETDGNEEPAAGGRSTVLRGEEAAPGYWMGIRYIDSRSEDNVIDGAEIRHTGAENWSYIESPSRAAVAAAVAAEATVRNCLVAEFEGVAFLASEDRPSAGDQTSTLSLSNNVVQ